MQTNDTTVTTNVEKKKPQVKDIVVTVVFSLFFAIFFFLCVFHKPVKTSMTENRELAQFPKLTWSSVFDKYDENGKPQKTFMQKFDDYSVDQFPFRDSFRKMHSYFQFYVMQRSESNGLAIKDNVVVKSDKELNEKSVEKLTTLINGIYDRYLKDLTDANIYFTVVPDKNYYFSEKYGTPAYDYEEMVEMMKSALTGIDYIDIFDQLELSDYYMTDTHWSQDKIVDVAKKIAETMGTAISGEYQDNIIEDPFYGVYYKQTLMNLKPDTIHYLTNDILNSCKVYDYMGKEVPMYNLDLFTGKDPYDVFLSGTSQPIIKIENPNATNDRNLVVFRDSYGSSFLPLLSEGYKTITCVDLRYVEPTMLSRFVNFENSDVLFMYSTLLINESGALKVLPGTK